MDTSAITDEIIITNPTLKRMHNEADGLQAFMDIPATLEDPAALNVRLNRMDVYKARLCDMLTRAKAMKEYAMNMFMDENEDRLNKLAVTVQNRVIKKALFEFTISVDRFERMYNTLDSLAFDLKTQISYIRTQMNLR